MDNHPKSSLHLITAAAMLPSFSTEHLAESGRQFPFLFHGLAQYWYDGFFSIGELLKYGDTGLGTFHALGGEMIVLDGTVYRAKGDGTVEICPKEERIPFASVAFLQGKYILPEIQDIRGLDALGRWLNHFLQEKKQHADCFYLARIDGTFSSLRVRSVYPQTKPYPPLEKVTEGQLEYTYPQSTGTLVALWGPDFAACVNTPGWHFHFISQDRKHGGHVLELQVEEAEGVLDRLEKAKLVEPKEENDVVWQMKEAFQKLEPTKEKLQSE